MFIKKLSNNCIFVIMSEKDISYYENVKTNDTEKKFTTISNLTIRKIAKKVYNKTVNNSESPCIIIMKIRRKKIYKIKQITKKYFSKNNLIAIEFSSPENLMKCICAINKITKNKKLQISIKNNNFILYLNYNTLNIAIFSIVTEFGKISQFHDTNHTIEVNTDEIYKYSDIRHHASF